MTEPTNWVRPQTPEDDVVDADVVQPDGEPTVDAAPEPTPSYLDVPAEDPVPPVATDFSVTPASQSSPETSPVDPAPAPGAYSAGYAAPSTAAPAYGYTSPESASAPSAPEFPAPGAGAPAAPPAGGSYGYGAAESAPSATEYSAPSYAQPTSGYPTTPPAPSYGYNPEPSALDLPPMPDVPGAPAPQQPTWSQPTPPASGYTSPQAYTEASAAQSYGHGAPTAYPQDPQPGYGQPGYPQPGYAPQGGYGQPGYPQPPAPGYYPATTTGPGDTMMASMSHWLALFVGFLAPLIVMLTKGEQDQFVKANAVESLNFNLTILIGYVVSTLLTFVVIGALGFIVLPILQLIFGIMGAIAANRGEVYRYPFSIKFIK